MRILLKPKAHIFFTSLVLMGFSSCGRTIQATSSTSPTVAVSPTAVATEATKSFQTGADQVKEYLPILKGKKVGLVVNQTSVIAGEHSVDALRKFNVNIVKAFGPEHGFRGQASAGAKVKSGKDEKTGIPVISLYGSHTKPTKEDLNGLDILVFDIQDVGARFYTYISTLHYVMEACAENNLPLLILDRPNPNGFFVDGPVLEEKYKSFIGMHPIPIVHGMTIAEYAQMINGEGWLKNGVKCKLHLVKMKGYKHSMPYTLPVKPSPNLNTQQSILLYPSLCLFEGTILSQGRGTYFPFQVLGAPELEGEYQFNFTPVSIPGMSESPLHMNKKCFGLDLRKFDTSTFKSTGKINLSWLIKLYKAYPDKEKFFDFKQSPQMNNIDKLAGSDKLRLQIVAGKSEAEIRKSWEPGLSKFKEMRKKYMIYAL